MGKYLKIVQASAVKLPVYLEYNNSKSWLFLINSVNSLLYENAFLHAYLKNPHRTFLLVRRQNRFLDIREK